MTIEEQIRQHEERITEAISHRYAGCCPHCHANEKFHRHEIRRRNFYYVGEDGQSLAVRSWLVRWRCGNCRMRFTDYPPFALRSKRYVKPAIFEMAAEFLIENRSTYRSVSRRRSSPSSLWRWLTWLGSLSELGSFCVHFVLQADPTSQIHRINNDLVPWKYRSKKRESIVSMALQILAQIVVFDRLVAERYSPS